MKIIWLALLAVAFVLSGCSDAVMESIKKDEIERAFPPNVENAEYLGNGWAYFELDGRTFLFYDGYEAYAITEISKKEEEVIE